MDGYGVVLVIVFVSVYVSLFEDVKFLLRRGVFKGLDFVLER